MVSLIRQESAGWLQAAAARGEAVAQFNLGVCYEKGTGVPKDAARAVEWYTRAAEAGDSDAQFNLGNCYKTGQPSQPAAVIATYDWNFTMVGMGFLANLPGTSTRRLIGFSIFQNEPFPGTGQATC